MTTTEPKFDVTRSEFSTIAKIAQRALEDLQRAWVNDPVTKLDLIMDIEATHCNGNPLRLDALLAADGVNFTHDILGIRRHLDRTTGRLGDAFTPRFTKRKAK